jgi:predicted nucleic acid-binding protein
MALLAPFLPHVEASIELRDPSDVQVIDAALAGHADVIVSGDRDLLEDERLRTQLADRRIRLLTPRELADELKR